MQVSIVAEHQSFYSQLSVSVLLSWYLVCSIWYLVSVFSSYYRYMVSHTWYLVSDFKHLVSSVQYLAYSFGA
jgi:hypothetical protein